MQDNEIPSESGKRNARILSKQHLSPSLAPEAGRWDMVTIYPDGSRSFDDLVSVISMDTVEGSPFVTIRAGFMFHHLMGSTQIHFKDGFLTPPHKHNFIELAYVKEGQLHKQIEGKDYVFNRGEFFLLNQNISHGEYYYRRNSAVTWLRLSNTFFDKSINHRDMALAGRESEEFLRRFIINKNCEYCFVRFAPPPPTDSSQVPNLFEQIVTELTQPQPGSSHIIIGYIERLLCLLSRNYKVSVEWNNRERMENHLFEKIRFLLEDCYEDVSMRNLIATFGHNTDYFNRLIKRHTGMTYSAFLQNIRLERAELLLKTTESTVEEIARKTGYKNLSYFYKIFTRKFQIKPNEMRKAYNDEQ